MNNELMKVLKMVEEGKLKSDEAKELMDAINSKNESIIVPKSYGDKFLKVNILSCSGDKVNVKLPIKVIKECVKATGKLPISSNNLGDINMDNMMDTISNCLDNEVIGEIVDITSANGDRIKVVVE